MSATINTFPPLNELTFRHWTLLIIVGLHLAFFWALNSGMAPDFVRQLVPPIQLLPTREPERKPKPPEPVIDPLKFSQPTLPVLPAPHPIPLLDDLPIPDEVIRAPEPSTVPATREIPREPVVTAPQTDLRGLSEPAYPPSEIRAGHEGTVLLSVYVLENGRVGDIRIDQSSGFAKLDESAVREARKWRFKPGLRDGVPVPMWKQVPITFQLRDAGRSPILRY
jgi:protein TonB